MGLEISDKDVELFQNLIHRKSGISLEGSRLDTLRAGLYTEIESKGFANPSQYYSFLRFHSKGQKELEELLSYVTINETYFFRNATHFEALREYIFAEIIKENKKDLIKIWSAGCSTGEEPYSIAMAFLDFFQNQEDLQIEILGTDIDKESLAKAEWGLYKKRALRVTAAKYKNKYFKANEGNFEIAEKLKDIVQFRYFNLMETPYPKPSVGNWDIIFCRNVVIYFNRESVHHVASSFHSVLADDGYFFMGHSETLDDVSDDFSLIELGDTFVYVKKPCRTVVSEDEINLPKSVFSPTGHVVKKMRKTSAQKKRGMSSELTDRKQGDGWERSTSSKPEQSLESAESVYREASQLFEDGQVDAALDKIEIYIESRPQDARGYILAGRIHADGGFYEKAVGEFEKSIELEPLLTEAHYLLGVIYQRSEQIAGAIDEFKKSIYIDKDFVLPYFSLACIYQSNSMKGDALREFNNALRILRKLQKDEFIPFSDGLTVRRLMQMCQKIAEELESDHNLLD